MATISPNPMLLNLLLHLLLGFTMVQNGMFPPIHRL
jgi:hypothetical protein